MFRFVVVIVLVLIAEAMGSDVKCGTPVTETVIFKSTRSENLPMYELNAASLESGKNSHAITITKTRFAADGQLQRVETLLSPNRGRTWAAASAFVPAEIRTSRPRVTPVRSGSDPRILYNDTEKGLLRSEDKGKTWVSVRSMVNGMSLPDFARKAISGKVSGVRVQLAAIHPFEPHTIFASFLSSVSSDGSKVKVISVPGLFVSKDGGDNWDLFSSNLVSYNADFPHPILAISPSNPSIMIGHRADGLVITRDGGGNWSPVGQQQALESPADLGPEHKKDVKRLRGLGIEPVLNHSWRRLDVYQIEFAPKDDKWIFLGTSTGIYASTDQGETWAMLNLPFRVLDSTNSFALNPSNASEMLVGSIFGVFLTRNGGCSFTRIYPSAQQ